jgi:hypothetical protein
MHEDGSGLQPWLLIPHSSQAVGLGWYRVAPQALAIFGAAVFTQIH